MKQLHEKRIKTDKLFQLLVKQQHLAHEAGNRKSVTLLASQRKEERDTLNKERLDIRNQIRVTQGLPPINDDDKPEMMISQKKWLMNWILLMVTHEK